MLGVANLLGIILAAFGAVYLLPIGCSLATGDGLWPTFLLSAAITVAAGLVLTGATWRHRRELKARDGFLLVTLAWILLAASATLPLLLALPGLSFTRAYFEATSGLTTTGSTVLSGLDQLAPSINFWRESLVWIGGLAAIVVAIGISPLLGVGGMQIQKANAPAPVKEETLAPRITEAARSLGVVYALLTIVGTVLLRFAGMTWFDAICHAFAAVGLGGVSTHDASIAAFGSLPVELVLMGLMLFSCLNYARHFLAFRRLSLEPYRLDPELKAIAAVLAVSILGITVLLTVDGVYPSFWTALRYSAFNVISMATTTGWVNVGPAGFKYWPVFAPIWMLFLSGIVCSTGSPGSGVKMFRTLVLTRETGREMKILVHPNAMASVRVGGRPVPERVADAVLAFVFLYFMTVSLLTFAMLLTGMSFETAFRLTVASINNTAYGIQGIHARNLHSLSDAQLWISIVAMLLGRLEIFTVIVLFTRAYWRK